MRWRLALAVLALTLAMPGCSAAPPPPGTVVILLSAAETQSSAGTVAIHSGAGWQTLGRFSGSVPASPRTVEAASAVLPAGTYDAMALGDARLVLHVAVASGVVEPVLLGITRDRLDPSEAYAGQEAVNLGLRELGGRYPRVPNVQLVDQYGRTVSTASWIGATTVLADFQADTAGIGAGLLALFRQLRHELAAAKLVELTTDPAQDTAPSLHAFAVRNGVSWTLATGSQAAVRAVLAIMGAAPEAAGVRAAPVVDLVDPHGFVLRHLSGVPSAAQVADAVAGMESPLPASALNRPEPAFALVSWSGATLRPGSFGGHPLVINFWASWCDPCRIEMPLLQQAAARHPGIAFLYVDEEGDQTAARAFFASLGLRGTVASDPDRSTAALFDVLSVPSTVFVTATGVIEGVQIGQLDQVTLESHLSDLGP